MQTSERDLKGLVCHYCKQKAVAISKCETGIDALPYVIFPLCSKECYEKYYHLPVSSAAAAISDQLSDATPTISADTIMRLRSLTTFKEPVPQLSATTAPLNKKLAASCPLERQQQPQPQPEAEDGPVFYVKPGIDLNTHEFTKDEMGQASWTILTAFAENYPDEPTPEDKESIKKFLDGFFGSYPCRMCREHFKPIYAENPPDISSRKALKATICGYHNIVNNKLGKPCIPCWKIGEEMSSFVCKE